MSTIQTLAGCGSLPLPQEAVVAAREREGWWIICARGSVAAATCTCACDRCSAQGLRLLAPLVPKSSGAISMDMTEHGRSMWADDDAHRPCPPPAQDKRNRRSTFAVGVALLASVCAATLRGASSGLPDGLTGATMVLAFRSGRPRVPGLELGLHGTLGLRGGEGSSLRGSLSAEDLDDDQSSESDSDVSVELTSIIGFGSFSTVYAGETRTGESVAVKRVQLQNTDEVNLKRLQREIRMLSKMDHPNVVRLLRVIEDEECVSLVQERCMGGELFDFVNDFQTFHANGERSWRRTNTTEMLTVTEEHIAKMVRQILLAVDYMHTCNIVHRDLKLENVMLTRPFSADKEPEVKVVDLGFSREISGASICLLPCLFQ